MANNNYQADRRSTLALSVIIPAMGAAAVEGDGFVLPVGFDLAGVQLKTTCGDYNARTIALKIQGSNAPGDTPPTSGGDWLDINPACGESFTVNASKRATNEAAGLSALGGCRWVRLVATPSGALANAACTCEAWLVAPGNAGSGRTTT